MPTKMKTDKMAETLTPIVTRVARLSEKPTKKSRKFGRFLIGGAIAVAAAIGIKKVLSSDEDEFDYEP